MDKFWQILLELLYQFSGFVDIFKLFALSLDLVALPTSYLRSFLYLVSSLILVQEAFLGPMALTPVDLLAASPTYTAIRNTAFTRQYYEGQTRNSYEDWNVYCDTKELDCSLVMVQATLCSREMASLAADYVTEQAKTVYDSAYDGVGILGYKTQETVAYIGEKAVDAVFVLGENAGPAAEQAKDMAHSMGQSSLEAATYLGSNAAQLTKAAWKSLW